MRTSSTLDPPPSADQEYLDVSRALEIRALEDWIRRWRQSFDHWLGFDPVDSGHELSDRFQEVRSAFSATEALVGLISADTFDKCARVLEPDSEARRETLSRSPQPQPSRRSNYKSPCETFRSTGWKRPQGSQLPSAESPLEGIATWASRCLNEFDQREFWIRMRTASERAEAADLSPIVAELLNYDPSLWKSATRKRFLTEWLESEITTNPALQEFVATTHDEAIERFRSHDRDCRIMQLLPWPKSFAVVPCPRSAQAKTSALAFSRKLGNAETGCQFANSSIKFLTISSL